MKGNRKENSTAELISKGADTIRKVVNDWIVNTNQVDRTRKYYDKDTGELVEKTTHTAIPCIWWKTEVSEIQSILESRAAHFKRALKKGNSLSLNSKKNATKIAESVMEIVAIAINQTYYNQYEIFENKRTDLNKNTPTTRDEKSKATVRKEQNQDSVKSSKAATAKTNKAISIAISGNAEEDIATLEAELAKIKKANKKKATSSKAKTNSKAKESAKKAGSKA